MDNVSGSATRDIAAFPFVKQRPGNLGVVRRWLTDTGKREGEGGSNCRIRLREQRLKSGYVVGKYWIEWLNSCEEPGAYTRLVGVHKAELDKKGTHS
jgi:hypothetical protein